MVFYTEIDKVDKELEEFTQKKDTKVKSKTSLKEASDLGHQDSGQDTETKHTESPMEQVAKGQPNLLCSVIGPIPHP